MTCPKCGKRAAVVNSEEIKSDGKPVVSRNRVCVPCGLTIKTHEQIVMTCKRSFHARKA